ncbi:MAG: dihydrolipoamide acyltransferase [Rhodocyclales bacterium]|nr:dihydrolipoamide acyltransferase [Rhodocyclales bacterium]
MPKYPECWETCGSCAGGDVFVIDVHVKPGDVVRCDDNVITLETGKVALDIPSPYAGTVVAVRVEVGDELAAGALIATIASA